MIYYFSATENSEWVAKQLAKRTNDTAVSMTDVCKGKAPLRAECGQGETLGIVFPIYAWSPPKIVTDFLKKLKVDKKAYVYAVATCQSEVGDAFLWLRPYLRMDARFAVCMPNNFVVWGYGKNQEGYNRSIILNALKALDPIAGAVNGKHHVRRLPPEAMRGLKTFGIAPLFRLTRSDRKFHVDEKCIGCGKCEALCPISNIRMQNGAPVWLHKHCMQCCACINRCPTQAIQYGTATQNSGRYVFPECW